MTIDLPFQLCLTFVLLPIEPRVTLTVAMPDRFKDEGDQEALVEQLKPIAEALRFVKIFASLKPK